MVAYPEAPPKRPTRWERAREDTQFFRAAKNAASAAVGGLVAAAVLYWTGALTSAVEQVIVVLVSAGVAIIAVPTAQLALNYKRAPMRQLQDDVAAILNPLASQGPSKTPEQEAADRTAREALTLIKGELEDIHLWLSEVVAAESWTGARVSMGHWYQRSGDVAQAGFQEVHKVGRTAYRAVGRIDERWASRPGQSFCGDDREQTETALKAVQEADGVFQTAISSLSRDAHS